MARTLTLERTKAQMDALIAQSLLNTQTYYKITDRGDRGLLFRAAAVNRLESDGIRYMLCPTTYAVGLDAYDNDWIGVWNATKQATATTGQLCIWNGLVWVAGETMDGNAPDTETSGWTVIPKASFTNHEYVEMIFGVTYDFENDWISKQWDKYDNVFGATKLFYLMIFGDEINRIDYCDWNMGSAENHFLFRNHCFACFNNSNEFIYENNVWVISNNSNTGAISNNRSIGSISSNSNQGEISNNSNHGSILSNSNDGDISKNSNVGSILNNSNIGDIKNNSNTDNIIANSSLLETTCSIFNNTSSTGAITGIWDADVTDPVVDKTGTAEPTTTL